MLRIFVLTIAVGFALPIAAQAGGGGNGGSSDSKTSVSPVSKTPAAKLEATPTQWEQMPVNLLEADAAQHG